jgi:hypothetical protein
LKVLFVEPPKEFWFFRQYIPPVWYLTLAGYLERCLKWRSK